MIKRSSKDESENKLMKHRGSTGPIEELPEPKETSMNNVISSRNSEVKGQRQKSQFSSSTQQPKIIGVGMEIHKLTHQSSSS